MAQSFIQAPVDGAGKKIDTFVTTTAAQHRQVMSLGDKATDANILVVDTHGSAQTTLVDSSGVSVPFNANGQATMANSAPVTLASDQTVPNALKTTSNGSTASRVNAAATTNATSLKASAGNIVNIDVFNVAAYSVFLKLYNKASAPTVGTDTPVWTIPIPAGGGYSKHFQYGKNFATGIAYAITKLQADSDTTVVVAGDLTGSIDWI